MNRTEEREALYTAYSEKVGAMCSARTQTGTTREDLVSDVFLKAYEKYPTFDADRASVSTWLYTITRNTVIDYFRTHRPGVELPDDLPDAAGIDDGLLQRESLQALGEALNQAGRTFARPDRPAVRQGAVAEGHGGKARRILRLRQDTAQQCPQNASGVF